MFYDFKPFYFSLKIRLFFRLSAENNVKFVHINLDYPFPPSYNNSYQRCLNKWRSYAKVKIRTHL